MVRRYVFGTAAMLSLTVSAFAQGSPSTDSQSSLNWQIFEKLYPPRALAAREEGAVGFTVTLDSKGEVTACQVTHSSGHPLLDEETCKVVTMHAQFTPDPHLGPSQTKTHAGLIAWKLPQSSTTLTPPKVVQASAAPEKMVCKKTVRAGTLAGFERTCLTPTEWAKQSDQQKEPFTEAQKGKGSTSGVPCFNPSGC